MFDCPKHRKTQKFVSWEKALVLEMSNPTNADNPSFIFIATRIEAETRRNRNATALRVRSDVLAGGYIKNRLI